MFGDIYNQQIICTTLFPPDSWLPYQLHSITALWWYQILLLSNGHVWTTCPMSLHDSRTATSQT